MAEIDSSFLNPGSGIKKAIRIDAAQAEKEEAAAAKVSGEAAQDFVALQNHMQDELVRLNEEIHSLKEEKNALQTKLDTEVAELEKSLKSKLLAAESELEIITNQFQLFVKMIDGLLDKLPPEALKEFSNSDDAKFYKEVASKLLK